MTISITQEHPASFKVSKLQSTTEMTMLGKPVVLPGVLQQLAESQETEVKVHQTFTVSAEHYPTVTFSSKREGDGKRQEVRVHHKVYNSARHAIRCTIVRDGASFETFTFPDVDYPEDVTLELETQFDRALDHPMMRQVFRSYQHSAAVAS